MPLDEKLIGDDPLGCLSATPDCHSAVKERCSTPKCFVSFRSLFHLNPPGAAKVSNSVGAIRQ